MVTSVATAQVKRVNGLAVQRTTSLQAMPGGQQLRSPEARSLKLGGAPVFAKNAFVPQPVNGDSIITTVAGTEHDNLCRADVSLYSSFGYLFFQTSESMVTKYTVGNDGSIYLCNPITTALTNTYLKLDKVDDTTYVAKMPQAIYKETADDGSVLYAYANRLTLQVTPDYQLAYALDSIAPDLYDNDMLFTLKDGILSQRDSAQTGGYPNEIIGLCDANGRFYSYGSGCLSVREVNETPTQLEDGLEMKDFVVTSNTIPNNTDSTQTTTKVLCKAAFSKDGKAFYIADPYDNTDGLYIKGEVSDDRKTVTFKRQYMGINTNVGYHFWFRPATYTITSYVDDWGWRRYGYEFHDAPELAFHVDEQTKAMKADDPQALVVNVSPRKILYAVAYVDPVYEEFNETAATPADPSVTEYNYWMQVNYGSMSFNIPCTDTQGNFINPNKLYYNFFVDYDDAPYEFAPDEYRGLKESMTDVPYTFTDGYDFLYYGDKHVLCLYMVGATKYGIQSVYQGGGETRKSNLVWYIPTPDGIKAISGKADVVKEECYDVAGRKVTKDSKGLVIRKTTYADGTVTTTKFMNP